MSSEISSTTMMADLPEILKRIEENWPILPSGLWNSSSIQKLSRLLYELALHSESEGEWKLHRVIMQIDAEINGIIDDNATPDASQFERLTHGLEQLRTMAGKQSASKPAQAPVHPTAADTTPFDLLYLCASTEEAAQLSESIHASGLRAEILTDPETLQIILAGPGSKTLLVDANYLGTQALEPVLHLSRLNRSMAPQLFVISDQSTVDTRLAAMRAGAAQLFTKPIEADQLIETLQQHIHPQPSPRYRVLIVEDDPSQANFASKLLEKGDLETLTITEPLSVIEAVHRFQPDLILMDLYMPGADGIELTRMIRDRWQSAATPVVFLSGEDDPEKKLLALLAGADDFLTKPVRPQQLLATVKTRISRVRQITDVVLQEAKQSNPMATRRELLNTLDMRLADEAPVVGFRALLVIRFGSEAGVEAAEGASSKPEVVLSAAQAIRPLMQADDTLAELEYQGLALLCQRKNELALENLAERVYKDVSESLGAEAPGSIGVGVVLLNSEARHAYEMLSRGESCAQMACEQKLQGYQLYGEETSVAPVTEIAKPGDTAECELLRSALEEGSLPSRKQLYSSLREHAVDIIELLPQLPHISPHKDLYELAAGCRLGIGFDRLVYQHALLELSRQVAQGKGGRILFRQSHNLMTEADALEFIKTQLRRCQIVGTGLMMELDLPSLAANLKLSRELIEELAAMGIAVTLSNFACNTTAFKVLSFLKADAIRPHPSMLQISAERVAHIAQQARALRAEIILPRVSSHDDIAPPWAEFADHMQADFAG